MEGLQNIVQNVVSYNWHVTNPRTSCVAMTRAAGQRASCKQDEKLAVAKINESWKLVSNQRLNINGDS